MAGIAERGRLDPAARPLPSLDRHAPKSGPQLPHFDLNLTVLYDQGRFELVRLNGRESPIEVSPEVWALLCLFDGQTSHAEVVQYANRLFGEPGGETAVDGLMALGALQESRSPRHVGRSGAAHAAEPLTVRRVGFSFRSHDRPPMTSLDRNAPLWLTLSAWLLVTLVWLANARGARRREERAKSLSRLRIWLLIAATEAGLYWIGDIRSWAAVYALVSGVAIGEVLRNFRVQSVLAIGTLAVVIAAVVATSPALHLLATTYLVSMVVVFGLPFRSSTRIPRLACACGCALFGLPATMLIRLGDSHGLNAAIYLALSGVHLIDILSGFAGKSGQRHPFGRLSPSKTGSGFLGGFCTGVAFAWLASPLIGDMTTARTLGIGVLVWLGAAAGDLAASKLNASLGPRTSARCSAPMGASRIVWILQARSSSC